MKVGINCLSIKPKYVGGVTAFTFGIIDGLLSLDFDIYYQIYVTKENYKIFERYKNEKNAEIIIYSRYNLIIKIISNILLLFLPISIYKAINNKLFKNLANLMDSKSDIVYTPSPTLINYNNKKPTFVSMHDIQHLHYPKYFNIIKLIHRKKNYLLTAQNSNYLQASSLFIKDDFLFHYSFLNEKNIFMINEGVNIDQFKINYDDANKNCLKYDIPKDFIFYPAQLWFHKDHITVLKALKILRDDHSVKINLVLTGDTFSASKGIFQTIDNYSLTNQVFYLGKVPFKDLLSLYALSKFFITATLYESSSLPLLEAAASGTAIIASDTNPNKEMSRFINVNLFNANNENSLTDIILKIWNNDSLRKNQIIENKKNINRYSWLNIAKLYVDSFIDINNDYNDKKN